LSLQSIFNRELDSLFKKRTDWLRHEIGKPRKGKPPVFNRKRRERTIKSLVEIVSKAQIKDYVRKEFQQRVEKSARWYPKKNAISRDEKKREFRKWYERKFKKSSCIYLFWAGNRCLYAGKTIRGSGRIRNHFEKHWFSKATRIDVFMARGDKDLPSLECLAIPRHKPKENDIRAVKKKGSAKCPLCAETRLVKRELRQIFPLK